MKVLNRNPNKKLNYGDFHEASVNNVQWEIEGEWGDSDFSQSLDDNFVLAWPDSDHSFRLKVEIARKKELEAKMIFILEKDSSQKREETVGDEEETNVWEPNMKVCLCNNLIKLFYFVIDMFFQVSEIFASKARAWVRQGR